MRMCGLVACVPCGVSSLVALLDGVAAKHWVGAGAWQIVRREAMINAALEGLKRYCENA